MSHFALRFHVLFVGMSFFLKTAKKVIAFQKNILKADSHIACRANAANHAVPLIHTCHAAAPAMLLQCRVLRESLRGSWKYLNCKSNSLTGHLFCSVLLPLFTVAGMDRCEEDWYASDNNLRGTPRGSWKKPNMGR